MPLVETLVGSHAHTLYDAIFDIELSDELEHELYEEFDDDDDAPALRSLASQEDLRRRNASFPRMRTPSRSRHLSVSIPNSPDRGLPSPGPGRAPMRRAKESITSLGSNGSGALKAPSPLARLFGAPRLTASASENTVNASNSFGEDTLAGINKLERLLDGIKNLPAQKIRDEMKDLQASFFRKICVKTTIYYRLQERQSRIESLLLTLTRGMRNETTSGSFRNSTL